MKTTEFKFSCGNCERHLRCETRFVGRQIQCPACQHLVNIPAPPPETGFTRVPIQRGRTWDPYLPPLPPRCGRWPLEQALRRPL